MERLLEYFKPKHYNLELFVFRQKDLVRGTVVVSGRICGDVIKFHAVGMVISDVYIEPEHWRYDYDSKDHRCEFKYDGEILEIPVTDQMRETIQESIEQEYFDEYGPDYKKYYNPNDAIRPINLMIKYERRLNHNMQGCYLSSYEYNGKEQQIVATQFESHYAREAFPCIDEPAAKAKFRLTLIVPDRTKADVILSNMPLDYKDTNRFTFETTPPMSTYLLAWVIGPFRSVSTVNQYDVKVSSYAPLNQSTESLIFANETAAKALNYYNEKFGSAYPLPKLDQVALPDFEAGAMENWGLVTYRESMMLADKSAALDTKKTVATTVTHELSHQWFGDLVTMEWWDDLWLNESFATMIEYCATDAIYPEFNIWEDFFTSDCLAALKRDALPGVQAVQQEVQHPSEIATLFDSAIVYAKGARLMLMLMRIMGEDAFYRGLSYYFDKYAYKNTVGDNLWESLQIFADFDVRKFMHAWISQPGYPALQTAHNGDKTWWEQQRFLINGTTDDTKWPLPEVKDDMSGHYLLDLSDNEFQEKLNEFDKLSQEQKLRLLIDRMFLAKADNVPSDSLLNLLQKFAKEQSSAVWAIIVNIINDLKLFCPPESDVEKNYKSFLRKITQEQAQKLDLHAELDANETDLRNVILGISYYAENQEILHKLANMYQSDVTLLDSELRGHILGAKLYYDEAEVFDELLKQYQSISDSEIKSDILYSLASCSRQENHLQRLIELLNQPKIVRPQDHLFLYIYLVRNYRSREQALDWLIKNWAYVEQLTGEKSIEDYPRLTASVVRTETEAEKFYHFFDTKKNDPILKRTIYIAHAEIDSRLSLIKRQSPKVANKLKELQEG